MKNVILVVFLVAGCGSEREIEVKAGAGGGGGGAPSQPPSGDGVLSFAEVKPLITTYCTPCHASDAFTKSSTGWYASAAPARTKNASMPPPASNQAKTLSAVDRQKLLNFK